MHNVQIAFAAPKGSDADGHCSSVPIIKSTQGTSPQRVTT